MYYLLILMLCCGNFPELSAGHEDLANKALDDAWRDFGQGEPEVQVDRFRHAIARYAQRGDNLSMADRARVGEAYIGMAAVLHNGNHSEQRNEHIQASLSELHFPVRRLESEEIRAYERMLGFLNLMQGYVCLQYAYPGLGINSAPLDPLLPGVWPVTMQYFDQADHWSQKSNLPALKAAAQKGKILVCQYARVYAEQCGDLFHALEWQHRAMGHIQEIGAKARIWYKPEDDVVRYWERVRVANEEELQRLQTRCQFLVDIENW